jgi:hypothetical protein
MTAINSLSKFGVLIGIIMFITSPVYTQVSETAESIPASITGEVRNKIEMLFSKDPDERQRAVIALRGMHEKVTLIPVNLLKL